MSKRFTLRQLIQLMATAGVVSLSNNVMAAAFQLWEQDAASIGNYHAGVAATADDASTAWYNPAGLVRIKNQQFVLGADSVLTDVRFKGTIGVNTLGPQLYTTTAQGGGYNFVPFGHFAAPISDRVVFGFSADAPFGLKTDYGNDTMARYAATLTSLRVIDVTPSLGVAITDNFSVGAGVDYQRLSANFDLTAGLMAPGTYDTQIHNEGNNTAYGYHLGGLIQFSPSTRLGVSYHSKVTHHVKGNSTFIGRLANNFDGGKQTSYNLMTHVTLPATTTVSLFHEINPKWDIMGSVSYTQWSVLKDLILQNASGIINGSSSTTITSVIPENYHNSWNYSVGANFHPYDKWIIRTGIGYDQTPTSNHYRNLQLPDSDRVAFALGSHYQASKTVGLDAGWTHVIGMNSRINNLSQPVGDQISTTNGSTSAAVDVFGLQVKWDIV